jgi:acyl-CoA hydrolase
MPERSPKSPRETRITLHQLMMPEHANAYGAVHGGVIMKMVDEAGGITAMRHAQRPCVTVAIDSMAFYSPVHVGELLSCEACVSFAGHTSLEVEVSVHAENPITGEVTHTNSAFVVYVAIDEDGKPTQVPELVAESDDDGRRQREAEERQRRRLRRRHAG